MPVPTLAELKRHMHIRHDADDENLQEKLDAAIDYATQFIDRPIPWLDAEDVEVDIPSSVALAIKIVAEEMYTGDNNFKKAENMLHFYRVGLGI
ncbi:head-tail connector protein [Pseudomonas sp. EA_35y_Pfl2_R111]|uniref:head-tail connector protein n=1 Tax=Pseudomonas sp. EA_35y_Pfl2_R111 TaxID=3088689 RepID=UPI0030DB8501